MFLKGTRIGLKLSGKAANVQIKTLKDQKAWRTIAQDHFKRLKESLFSWKLNIKKEWLDQDFFLNYCLL